MATVWDITDDGTTLTVKGTGLPDGECYAEIHSLPIPPNESTTDVDAAVHRSVGNVNAGEVVFHTPDEFQLPDKPRVVFVAAVTAASGVGPGKAVQIAETLHTHAEVFA